jgi:hypothetical protein
LAHGFEANVALVEWVGGLFELLNQTEGNNYMKHTLKAVSEAIAAAAFAAGAAASHAALTNPGDLAFTSFNADEDGWSMVALSNIDPNTTVYFTDNEWNGLALGGGGAFNTGESYHQWVSGSSLINAGTVIRFSAIDNATSLAASVGSLSRATVAGSTNYGVNQTQDTVYAYLGSAPSAPTIFLSAVTNNGVFDAAQGLITSTGLTLGNSAIALTLSSDYAEYTGSRSNQASFAQYLPFVGNVANWNVQGDGTFAATIPNTTAFTVTPVPEASEYSMMLAGLGMIGLLLRERRAQPRA